MLVSRRREDLSQRIKAWNHLWELQLYLTHEATSKILLPPLSHYQNLKKTKSLEWISMNFWLDRVRSNITLKNLKEQQEIRQTCGRFCGRRKHSYLHKLISGSELACGQFILSFFHKTDSEHWDPIEVNRFILWNFRWLWVWQNDTKVTKSQLSFLTAKLHPIACFSIGLRRVS